MSIQNNEFSHKVFDYKIKENAKNVPLHSHLYIEIIYIVKGKISCFTKGTKYVCNEGDLFIVNSGELHGTQGYKGTEMMIFQISLELLKNYYSPPKAIQNYISLSMQKKEYLNGTLYELINRIYEHNKNSNPIFGGDQTDIHDKNIVISTLITFYSLICKYFPSYENDTTRQLSSEEFYDIADYINNNLSEPITLSTLAKKFNYSEGYTSKLFKKHFEISFKKYLVSCRLEKATQLLLRTNKSISEISLECGFNSQRSFYKQFIAYYNMPPSIYRKEKNTIM